MPSRFSRYYGRVLLCSGGLCVFYALTAWLQRYVLAELEENYIFLYDWGWIGHTAAQVGGAAQLLASWISQFFYNPWIGAALLAAAYALIAAALSSIYSIKAQAWRYALALLPCLCLFLCLENNAYKLQGHAAVLLTSLALWAYSAIGRHAGALWRTVCGLALVVALYWAAGSVGVLWAVCALIVDVCAARKRWWLSVVYAAAACAMAYVCYATGLVASLSDAYGPEMYYIWDSTAYMMLYAWAAIALVVAAEGVFKRQLAPRLGWMIFAGILVCEGAIVWNLYGHVHSAANYRIKQQRYYAKHGDWDAILAIDYGSETTPYTSYRLLALAHKGQLTEQLRATRPYIDYLMKNKSLVKKEDQQILSDVWYDCDYMAAARKAAFDTDIVTPGAFNPYETAKLAVINMAYGDYGVAEKLLGQLAKTWRWSNWAQEMQQLLWDDESCAADPVIGPKRRAIPAESDYMRPLTIGHDLAAIVEANPDQGIAAQFLAAYTTLTGIPN